MRKTTVTIVALGIVWIGYTAWPLYELLVFVRAIEVRDVEMVKRPFRSLRPFVSMAASEQMLFLLWQHVPS